MKTIITIFLLSISSFAFAQTASKPEKDSVRTTALQIQKLQEKDAKVAVDVKDFNEAIELISGYKIEEIESWKVENGYLKFTLKRKK